MMRYFIVPSLICLFLFTGCTSLRNDPAIKEWKNFHTRILISDAITGGTWEILKLHEVGENVLYTKFAIYDIESMRFEKANNELNKILRVASLRSGEISKVISFLQDKGIDRDVLERYKLVLLMNKEALDMAKLVFNSLNKIKANNNKINKVQQKELNKFKKQLSALKTQIDRLNSEWWARSRSNPDCAHSLISKTFPAFFQSSIRAYGATKFYKVVDSYIENGELVIAKIIKLKKNTGHWANRNKIFDDEDKFYNWQYSTKNNSFSIQRSIDLLGPNKYTLQYIYDPPQKNGWYLEFLESKKSAFMKKSPIVEKYESSQEAKTGLFCIPEAYLNKVTICILYYILELMEGEKEKVVLKKSSLQQAIENENIAELEKLKLKINSKHPFQYTIERKGIKCNYKEICTSDTYPLTWAVSHHKKKSVKKLLDLGASVNIQSDEARWTLLHCVLYHINDETDIDILKLLLEQKDININAICDTSDSALSLAVKRKNYEAVELLLQKGADPDIFITEIGCEGEEGYIPDSLLYLSMFNKDNFKMFKLLLKYGANINLKDKNGDTILDKFHKEEYDPKYFNVNKFIAFLKKHGAKTAKELKKIKEGK